ncbi:MAG: RNA polymerase sigma factor [Acidimicrobiales bacterium]
MSPSAGSSLESRDTDEQFNRFFVEVEPRLRRALVARYGQERGREATAEALAWAWEHWSRVEAATNPLGYLYRVGQTRTRLRRVRPVFDIPAEPEPFVEPALASAVKRLPERQRVVTLLVHGAGWTHSEVAGLLGIATSTVNRHSERGLAALRRAISGVANDHDR